MKRRPAITKKGVRRELAKRYLYDYCRLSDPKAYNDTRPHLKHLCTEIQLFLEGKLLKPDGKPYLKLMLNLPPRHYKTYTLINAVSWWLGNNIDKQVISLSYNDILANRFSTAIRDKIDVENVDVDKMFFSDVFDVKLKHGDKSKKVWSLEGSHHSYLGGSLNSTVTGMGCQLGIIDDPIKNDKEAFNDVFLEDQFFHYANTFLSRLEEGGKQILNMTRWSPFDLCGRLLEEEPGEWYQIKMPAVLDYETEKMLCSNVMSFESFISKTKLMDDGIVAANYQQEPIPAKGLRYPKGFKIYEDLPEGIIRSYTDTADEGDDYWCTFIFIEYMKEAFIIDVIYTQDNTEDVEPIAAKILEVNGVNEAIFESNNGGKQSARFVASKMETNLTVVKWFHQGENKAARIASNAPWVMEHVYFPKNWPQRWPIMYQHLRKFKKLLKDNVHDDAPDCLTGVAEMVTGNDKLKKAVAVGNKEFYVI